MSICYIPSLLSGTKIFPQFYCDWKTNQILGWCKFIMFLFVVAMEKGTETQRQAKGPMIIWFGFEFVCAAWFYISGMLKWHFQFRSSAFHQYENGGFWPFHLVMLSTGNLICSENNIWQDL